MRIRNTQSGSKAISVHVIGGTHVVLLCMDATEKARKGLLGFAIHRKDVTNKEQYWLRSFRTFEALDAHPAPGSFTSTLEAPIQGFMWGDYTATPNTEYVYKVVPVYGQPKNLEYGKEVEVAITTENEDNKKHAIYFNRGVAGSQAYARKFGNKSPEEVGPAAFKWLSRGLEESILKFIKQAKSKNYSLRVAAYEFSHKGVLNAFKKASDKNADVKIVYDCRNKDLEKTSNKAIEEAGIEDLMIPRRANTSYIAHNKFIVLLKKGKPIQVLTGSTNFTDGGIYGQSNVVHIVRDKAIAAQYLDYWTQLSEDAPAKALRPLNATKTPTPTEDLTDGIHPVFSPRPDLGALEWYGQEIDNAEQFSGLTAAFGVNKLFADLMGSNKKNIRYLLLEKTGKTFSKFKNNKNNFISIGAVLNQDIVGDSELHSWVAERLTGLNTFVKYLHTKYLFIDPLGDKPIVISGSANFSDASTKNNDENMLVIKGNTLVADVYLGEFMRLWNHFYFRDIANRYAILHEEKSAPKVIKKSKRMKKSSLPYLKPNDSWTDAYYGKHFQKTQERLLFK